MAGRPPKPLNEKKATITLSLDQDLLCNHVKAARKQGVSLSHYVNEKLKK